MTKAILLSTVISLSFAFAMSPVHSAERQISPGVRDSCESDMAVGDRSEAALGKAFIQRLASKSGEIVPIDFTDPVMEAGYRAILNSHGLTPENSPRRYARIEQVKKFQARLKADGRSIRPASDETRPAESVYSLGFFGSDWSSVQAAGFATIYNPGEVLSVQNDPEVYLYAADCSILAYGRSERDGLDAKAALLVTQNAKNRPLIYYGPLQVSTVQFGTDINNNPVAQAMSTPLTDVKVDSADLPDPKWQRNPQSGPVIVCLNRSNPEPNAPEQCDYGPLQPNVSNEEAHLLLVVRGQITTYDPIMRGQDGRPLDPFGEPVKTPELTLSGTDTGGSCKKREADGDFWSKVTFSNYDKTVSWDYSQSSSLADFGPLCWANNSDYIFNLMVTLYTQKDPNSSPKSVYVVFTNAMHYGGYKPSVGTVTEVPRIQMQYGCILAGTPITMADGSQKLVEDVRPGDLLRSRNGTTLRVRSRMVGTDAKFVGLIDEKGNRVVVTEGHPMPTGRGIIKASDIAVGDMIEAEGGPVKITQVDRQTRDEVAQVYSLNTESADGSPLADNADGVFYAGNILVGDQKLQQQLHRTNKVAQQ